MRLVYLQYLLICHGLDKVNKIYAKSNIKKMVSRTGQEIRLKQYPKGIPTKDIFELAKVNVPEPKEGEFLVRNIWMSVDPYMRGRMRSPQETKSYISSFN